MAWVYLLLAGVCEIGWPLGLKLAGGVNKFGWSVFAIISMGLSGIFLFIAQKNIPMGTAYAIWTGIGAVGAFVLGVLYFRDPLTTARALSVFLIIAGIIGLKLTSH